MEAKKLPNPTGNIWEPNIKNPATVPISTKLVKTHIQGPFRERERKLWTFLIQAAWDELDIQESHELPLSKIGKVFRELSGDHNTQWLKDYLLSIAQTTVQMEAEDETAKVWAVSNLISNAEIIQGKGEHEGKDILRFSFPKSIIRAIKERGKFARLRPHLMITLSGKYAVTLYELLESVANQKTSILKASIEDLRVWLATPKDRLKLWNDFHRYVIKPAVRELNKHSEETGFTVSYDLIRGERKKVLAVHFHVHKVASRVALEKEMKRPEVLQKQSELGKFTPREYEILKKQIQSTGLDIYALEADWRDEFEDKADTIKNPIGHFTEYCKRRAGKGVNKSSSKNSKGLFGWLSGR